MKPQKPYPVSVAFGSVRWIATKVADALLLYVLFVRNYQKNKLIMNVPAAESTAGGVVLDDDEKSAG